MTVSSMAINVPFVVCEAIVTVVALVGNLLVILAFCSDPRVRSLRNYHLLSLSVADFLTASVGIPLYLWSLLTSQPRHFHLCLMVNAWILVLCAVSILSLVAISTDRFLSIVTPVKYRQKMTCRVVGGMIAAAWMVGCGVGLLPLMGWNLGQQGDNQCVFIRIIDLRYLVFLYFATVLSPLLIMLAMYCKIFTVIRQRQRHRKGATTGTQREDSQEGIQTRRDIYAAKIIATIIVAFALSWVPLYTINAVMHFCSTCHIPQAAILVSIWLTHFNSAVNPFLYAIGLREVRSAIRVVLNICRGRKSGFSSRVTQNGDVEKSNLWDVPVTEINDTGLLETHL